jgi:hypothetical protein
MTFSEQVSVAVSVKASPGSVCDVSVACSTDPAPENLGRSLRRPVCVGPSRVVRPPVAGALHVAGRERGGAA